MHSFLAFAQSLIGTRASKYASPMAAIELEVGSQRLLRFSVRLSGPTRRSAMFLA